MGEHGSNEDHHWLDDLQKNSWNPEILISGFTLAFILAFPASIFEFSVRLIQDWGINFIGGWLILIYLSGLINVFKIFLISHLSLRFIWVGLLGISYAFPKGVINENLFKYQKTYTYFQPKDMVFVLEKLCSMAFGIPVIMAAIFIPITLVLILLLSVYKFFNLDFFVIYSIFLVLTILISVYSVLISTFYKNKVRKGGYLGSLISVYASNIGKWRYNGYFLLIFIVSVPFIKHDTQNFFLFFHNINLDSDQLEWPQEDWYFQDARNPDMRFARVLLPSSTITENQVKMHLAYYGEDFQYVEVINEKFINALDTMNWDQVLLPTDLYRFYLDDSLISLPKWEKVVLGKSHQKAYATSLNLEGLSTGFHTLRVEKLFGPINFFDQNNLRLREDWAKVSFYKN